MLRCIFIDPLKIQVISNPLHIGTIFSHITGTFLPYPILDSINFYRSQYASVVN